MHSSKKCISQMQTLSTFYFPASLLFIKWGIKILKIWFSFQLSHLNFWNLWQLFSFLFSALTSEFWNLGKFSSFCFQLSHLNSEICASFQLSIQVFWVIFKVSSCDIWTSRGFVWTPDLLTEQSVWFRVVNNYPKLSWYNNEVCIDISHALLLH